MKKNKMKDTTKFIIALSICLGIICTSIVFASVFSKQEESAKAETITNDGYSFAFYDSNEWDADLNTNYYFTNRPDTDTWNACFAYFAKDGQPYNFNDGYLPTKSNVSVEFQIYNPFNAYIYLLELNNNATTWGSTFQYRVVDSNETIIHQTLIFDNFDNSFGGICFDTTTRAMFYVMYAKVSFVYNGASVNIIFGSPDILNSVSSYVTSQYNAGFADGVQSISSSIVPPLPSYSLQGVNFSSSPFSFETASSDIDVYSSTNGVFQNVAFGFLLNASPNTFYANTDYKIEFSVSVPDLSPLANSLSSCFLYGSANVYTTYDNITFSSSSSGNYTYYSGFVFSVTDAQYGLGIRFNFDNLDLPIARNYLMSINNIRITAIDASISAYEAGYDIGYEHGQTSGYNEGYTDGLATNDHTFLGLMGAVVDAPIQAVMNMFDFDILGMNMRGFYLSLFTLCLVITIVKFVLVK